MAFNVAALSGTTTAAVAISNLILVNPQVDAGIQAQNQGDFGSLQSVVNVANFLTNTPPSFLFDYEGENSVILQSEITDHYIENNTVINDQVALRPEKYMVHGFISELNDIPPRILAPLKQVADKLTVLSAYTPVLSITAIRSFNRAQQLYNIANLAVNAGVAAWNGGTGQTKQQKAFFQFYGYWKNRTLFTVQTPWAIFKDMAIESLRAVQGEETRVITDFEITFKKMRFASTTVSQSSIVGNSVTAAQASSEAQNGVSAPTESTAFSQAFSANLGGVL